MDEQITVISEIEEIAGRKAIERMRMEVAGDLKAQARIVAFGVIDDM